MDKESHDDSAVDRGDSQGQEGVSHTGSASDGVEGGSYDASKSAALIPSEQPSAPPPQGQEASAAAPSMNGGGSESLAMTNGDRQAMQAQQQPFAAAAHEHAPGDAFGILVDAACPVDRAAPSVAVGGADGVTGSADTSGNASAFETNASVAAHATASLDAQASAIPEGDAVAESSAETAAVAPGYAVLSRLKTVVRARSACRACNERKLRCRVNDASLRCDNCISRGIPCEPRVERKRGRPNTHRSLGMGMYGGMPMPWGARMPPPWAFASGAVPPYGYPPGVGYPGMIPGIPLHGAGPGLPGAMAGLPPPAAQEAHHPGQEEYHRSQMAYAAQAAHAAQLSAAATFVRHRRSHASPLLLLVSPLLLLVTWRTPINQSIDRWINLLVDSQDARAQKSFLHMPCTCTCTCTNSQDARSHKGHTHTYVHLHTPHRMLT